MEIRQCGRSGLRVSSLGLGTLTWGRDTDGEEAWEMLSHFVDAGGTLVECSPMNGEGMATDVLGAAMNRVGRHRLTIAWRGATRRDQSGHWVSSAGRGDMLRSLDDALARLDTDYVDVWMAEPDPSVPLEETLGVLEAASRSGRTHYVGLSGWDTWTTACALTRLGEHGLVQPAVAQLPVSLLTAPATHSLRSHLADEGLGVFARSPLAGGVLTGKYRHSTPPDSRGATEHMLPTVAPFLTDEYAGRVEAVVRAAQGLDRNPGDVALAWVRDMPGIASAICGPRNVRQLDHILDSTEPLPAPIRQVLNEVAYS